MHDVAPIKWAVNKVVKNKTSYSASVVRMKMYMLGFQGMEKTFSIIVEHEILLF